MTLPLWLRRVVIVLVVAMGCVGCIGGRCRIERVCDAPPSPCPCAEKESR
jgi:hypothetical protein